MDVKKLGRFHAPGHALRADRTRRSPGAGWEYVHSIIDDCSRLAYSEIHDDETAVTVTAFTRRALDWFLDQGIVCERLMTDNAFAYTQSKSFKQLLWRRAIIHIRTRPYTPRTNGKVERFHQTLMREWAYALQYTSSAARRQALPHWINHFNERRTHSALGNQSPQARVRDVTGHNSYAPRNAAATLKTRPMPQEAREGLERALCRVLERRYSGRRFAMKDQLDALSHRSAAARAAAANTDGLKDAA
jgi:Integrase core domain